MCNDSPLKVLIEQVGGESQFSFLTEAYCESIQEDSDLQIVFKGIDSERLVELITNLLNIGFAYTSHDSMVDDDIRSRIVLKNYTLFELGLNALQLKKLQGYFESALLEAWVEGEVFEQCSERFSDLRAIFEEESLNLPQADSPVANIAISRAA